YFEFFTDKIMPEDDPLTVKKQMALEITRQYHGMTKAHAAQKQFEQTFQKKQPEFKQTIKAEANLMLTIAALVGSNSEAKRLISQGAVDINGAKAADPLASVKTRDKLKIGQRIFVQVK
ncbi:hypothetical protein KKH13_01720, partial [Patescibacteria group bacterium]|nr:hypothetical protein [Patescibacteria group bacterium]